MKTGYMTDGGRRRPINEDAVKVLEDVNFYMLADGVGGNRSGEIASQSALDALEKFIRHNPPEWLEGRDEIFRYLRAAVRYVNQFIIRLSESQQQYAGMATTLTFAYIREDEMFVANVGDSRVYLIHDGIIQQITEDHTYVNDLVKMGAITREQAHTHARKNVITRAIGANANNEPDCFCVPVAAGDRVLLCSDGLYDEVDDDDILSTVSRFDDMMICAEDLVSLANNNGGNDNISVICVNLMEE
ncbi:MAG: Stp1/IreP family PP2C-type Ser/Thr phosphatase [Mogibacterium sp.]|nr:Stp1/IreP family PP2C-type Ser/Thr phosphatase [Mogibacterium sp.]MBR2540089.1 Stp1/IreP family PP2C-type Ser/Thr phosphatase [Mogibacterium sp.]